METIYTIEKVITNEAFEEYDHHIVFVTNDLTFANNKIKKLIAEETVREEVFRVYESVQTYIKNNFNK